MKDNKNSIRDSLTAKFDSMVEQTKTDPKLKEDVFNTLATLENIANIVELFTGKLIQSEATLVDHILKNPNRTEN